MIDFTHDMRNIPVTNDTFKNMGTEAKPSKVRTIPKERLQDFDKRIQKVLDELFQMTILPLLDQKITEITSEIRLRLKKIVPYDILDALDNKIYQVRPKTIKPVESIAWEEIAKSRELNINPEKLATAYALVQTPLEQTSSEELLRNLSDLIHAIHMLEHLKKYETSAQEKVQEWDDDDKEQQKLEERLARMKSRDADASLPEKDKRELQRLTGEKYNSKIRTDKRTRANVFLKNVSEKNFHQQLFGPISPKELDKNVEIFAQDKRELTPENFHRYANTLTINNLFDRIKVVLPALKEFCKAADIPFGTDFPDTENIPDIIKRLSDELHETFRIELIKQEVQAMTMQVVIPGNQTKEKAPRKKVRASKAVTVLIGAVVLMAIGGVAAFFNAPAPKPKSEGGSYLPPMNPNPRPPIQPKPENRHTETPVQPKEKKLPDGIEELSDGHYVVKSVPFIETQEATGIQYRGTFDYEIDRLKGGSMQITVHKQGGNPFMQQNMTLSCWFVVSNGRITMGEVSRIRGRESVGFDGMGREIMPADIQVSFQMLIEHMVRSNMVNDPRFPQEVRKAIFGR